MAETNLYPNRPSLNPRSIYFAPGPVLRCVLPHNNYILQLVNNNSLLASIAADPARAQDLLQYIFIHYREISSNIMAGLLAGLVKKEGPDMATRLIMAGAIFNAIPDQHYLAAVVRTVNDPAALARMHIWCNDEKFTAVMNRMVQLDPASGQLSEREYEIYTERRTPVEADGGPIPAPRPPITIREEIAGLEADSGTQIEAEIFDEVYASSLQEVSDEHEPDDQESAIIETDAFALFRTISASIECVTNILAPNAQAAGQRIGSERETPITRPVTVSDFAMYDTEQAKRVVELLLELEYIDEAGNILPGFREVGGDRESFAYELNLYYWNVTPDRLTEEQRRLGGEVFDILSR